MFLVLVFPLSLGCPPLVHGASPDVAVKGERYNLLLFLVNCLNKNHLDLYGHSRATTPRLNHLARNSYVFKNLVSPATYTPPVLRELFEAKPADSDLLEIIGWPRWKFPSLMDYPIGRYLAEQGYDYLYRELPMNPDRPFVSYFHSSAMHRPYDLYRRHGRRLHGRSKRLYKSLSDRSDIIRLVDKPGKFDQFPAINFAMVFGVARTEIPVANAATWNGILASLKETGDSPAGLIAAGLPPRLSRRLAVIESAEQLSLNDKSAIVRALNHMVNRKDSPIGEILFGPRTYLRNNVLMMEGIDRPFAESKAAFTIHNQFIRWKYSAIINLGDDRLHLAKPLTASRKYLLRQIYRETLEFIIPALNCLYPNNPPMLPSDEALVSWAASPEYEGDLALLKDLYDAGLRDLDREFGEHVEHLRRIGVLERTIVVYMGDHGEAFMEHGRLEHSAARCYDEIINAPMIVYVPGRLTKTVFVDAQLRTADVFPTLLDLMGLHPPEGLLSPAGGRSVVSSLGGARLDSTVFSRDAFYSRSIRRSDGWKLIWDISSQKKELYNLKLDPKETIDRSREFPDVTAELEGELNQFLYGE